jgi:dephospho-CoA kinase
MDIPNLIILTGRKQNGKDTIANYLIKKYNYIALSFADPLKDICKILFNFNYEQLYGSKKEDKDLNWKITPREAFQFIGTDLFRKQMNKLIHDIGDDFWVTCLVNKIKNILEKDNNAKIIIVDTRFPNEFDALNNLKINKISIRVSRPDLELSNYTHESEKYVDNFKVDYDIINNSSITELYEKIDKIV